MRRQGCITIDLDTIRLIQALLSPCDAFQKLDNKLRAYNKYSTFPLVIKELLNNACRIKKISDREMDKTLSAVLGTDWRTYIQTYGTVMNNEQRA